MQLWKVGGPSLPPIERKSLAIRSSRSYPRARPRVLPESKNVSIFAGVNNHASACLVETSFNVVDGGRAGVDRDRGDPDRLQTWDKLKLEIPFGC